VDRSWRIVEALLVEMRRRLTDRGVPLLVVWQGDADPDYAVDVRSGLETIARRQNLDLVDPSQAFIAAAAGREQPFRIPGDGHWNADGHRVVGTMLVPIVERLLQERGKDGT
jgi:lysophospholipase L1-like esterase